MKKPDYYAVLGLEISCTRSEIRQAYLQLAKVYHPDKNNANDSDEKFKALANAYETLYDIEKRKIYDLHYKRNKRYFCSSDTKKSSADNNGSKNNNNRNDDNRTSNSNNNGNSSSDNSSSNSEQHRGKKRPHQNDYSGKDFAADADGEFSDFFSFKPTHIEVNVKVQLNDLYMGNKIKVNHPFKEKCLKCKGTRKETTVNKCFQCNGSGEILFKKSTKDALKLDNCYQCKGSGVTKTWASCGECFGYNITTQKTSEITIPKDYPITMIVKDEAGLLGDLHINFTYMNWNEFERLGSNIYKKVTISLQEALFGFDRVLFKHIDGRKIKCKHLAGEIIEPGAVKCIRNEGMPATKGHGDLFVVFNIVFPKKLKLDLPHPNSDIDGGYYITRSCLPDSDEVQDDEPIHERVFENYN